MPGRGRYDRSVDASVRRDRQRRRLVDAVCTVLVQVGPHDVSVERVTRQARVGRNTFYDHFADVPEAIETAAALAAEDLIRGLDAAPIEARTPVEKIRAFGRFWFQLVTGPRAQVECALSIMQGQRRVLSAAGELLCQRLVSLVTEARSAAALSAAPELSRVIACTAAIEGLSRALLAARISRADAESAFVDVSMRLFR